MGQKIQFKASVMAAAISVMAAGPALATPTEGNILVGPDLDTSGVSTVKIDQSGTGNITSSSGAANGAAFIVDQSAGATTALTIQQVGTTNSLGLRSYTSDVTKVQVFQGADAETGSTGKLGTDATKLVNSNSAVVQIGADATQRAGATDVFLTQQGDNNVAATFLGRATGAFTGTLNLLQVGNGNLADVVVNGQTTAGQTFNIGQSGGNNALSLTANGDQSTGMTLDFGGLTFGRTTSLPGASDTSGNNNVSSYTYSGANSTLNGYFTGSLAGINVLGTDEFKIKTLYGPNNIQVDLASAAATGNKIDVTNFWSNFAIYGKGGAAINLGGSGRLSVDGDLVVYANGGSISVNNTNFYGRSDFSTADGGSITYNGGDVFEMSVSQSGAAHSFSSTNGMSGFVESSKVTQTGPIVNSMVVNNSSADNYSGFYTPSFTLTQTSETGGGGHAMTLYNNGNDSSSWTVAQSGAGAKTLGFTSNTGSAVINATQTGLASQSATGINFAAASGSSFTLAQR